MKRAIVLSDSDSDSGHVTVSNFRADGCGADELQDEQPQGIMGEAHSEVFTPSNVDLLGGIRLEKRQLTEVELIDVRAALTVRQTTRNPRWGLPPPFAVYREDHEDLIVPRHFPLDAGLRAAARQTAHVGEPLAVEVAFVGQLSSLQQSAVDAVKAAYAATGGAVLNLYCGGGKTVCALHLVAAARRKTLVIVHKQFLVDQWAERIRGFLPAARVGRIKQSLVDVEECDVVVGMLQSIARRSTGYPLSSFGHVIVDECHHICAKAFSQVRSPSPHPRHSSTPCPLLPHGAALY